MFSVVEHKDDPNIVIVRARIENDIKKIQQMFVDQGYKRPGIFLIRHSDYKFRIFVSRKEWINVMARLMTDLHYTNFKDAVIQEDAIEIMQLRDKAYTGIWSIMYRLQNNFDQDRLKTNFLDVNS